MADDVIEFEPFLKRKRSAACDHPTYYVGMKEASIVCQDCDAELDPWWVLRSLVLRSEEEAAAYAAFRERAQDAFVAWQGRCREAERKHEAWVRQANEQIQKLTADKNRLMAEKLRLVNDPEIARARASRRAKGPQP